MSVYDDTFYKDRHRKTQYAARNILSIILQSFPGIQSAVDVGCGVGTWLSVLKDMGIDDVQGIDGDWVNKDLLEIEQERFMVRDLGDVINTKRKYDLAISLEVAEHLPSSSAEGFVQSLTNMADIVLFSGAIAYQGEEAMSMNNGSITGSGSLKNLTMRCWTLSGRRSGMIRGLHGGTGKTHSSLLTGK